MSYFFDMYGWYVPGATSGWGSTEVAPPPQETWLPGQQPMWNLTPNDWKMIDYIAPPPPPPPPDPDALQKLKDKMVAVDIRKVRAMTDAILSSGWDTQRLQQLEQECQVLRSQLHDLGYYGETSVTATPAQTPEV